MSQKDRLVAVLERFEARLTAIDEEQARQVESQAQEAENGEALRRHFHGLNNAVTGMKELLMQVLDNQEIDLREIKNLQREAGLMADAFREFQSEALKGLAELGARVRTGSELMQLQRVTEGPGEINIMNRKCPKCGGTVATVPERGLAQANTKKGVCSRCGTNLEAWIPRDARVEG